MSTTVRNIRGTSERTCACGSWIIHHVGFTGSRRDVCSALGCSKQVEVGAHVHDILANGGSDFTHYIVLFCHGCNRKDDDVPLKRTALLAPANIKWCTGYR